MPMEADGEVYLEGLVTLYWVAGKRGDIMRMGPDDLRFSSRKV